MTPDISEEADDALSAIEQWCGAYPEYVFPPVSADELKRAVSAVIASGISSDRLHASWARHIAGVISPHVAALRARVTELEAALAEVVRERDEAQKQARMASFAGEGYAHMELRALAAEADKVRAVAAERERAAQCAESIGAVYAETAKITVIGKDAIDLCMSGANVARNVADRIRARSEGDHPQATDGGME